MPVIITATDFSDVSDKAVNYACTLASHYNASVIIFHSYIIPVAFSETPMPVMPIEDGREIAENGMKTFVERIKGSFPDVDVEGKVVYGDIIDNLQEYLDQNDPWLIVLGNSANEDTSFLFGSTVLSALRNLQSPVVAVPQDAVYAPVRNICFACDYTHIAKGFPAQQIIDLVQVMKAKLHILYINTEDTPGAENSKALQSSFAIAQPEYHFVDNKNIDEAIQSFIETNHMDWLIVIPHRHSFFESLTHKSHTKAMVQMSHIPLVALHGKKKEE